MPQPANALSPQDLAKKAAAEAALRWVADDALVGVGTGSTVNFFIDALAAGRRVRGAVSSSEGSTARLRALGIPVFDLNDSGDIDVYIDGADETNSRLELIKGGGAALTREKIVAAASRTFVCIVDASKVVDALGRFPLPVEVIPMARAMLARRIREHCGGDPVWRQAVVTDNGNHILDVRGLRIERPRALEQELKQMTGVVEVGLFALRPADVLLVGSADGVRELAAADAGSR
jgi:ribose 5-phosphate isomerase A